MRDRNRPATPAEVANRLFEQRRLELPQGIVVRTYEKKRPFPFMIVGRRRRGFWRRKEQVVSSSGTTPIEAFRGLGPLWKDQIGASLRRKA